MVIVLVVVAGLEVVVEGVAGDGSAELYADLAGVAVVQSGPDACVDDLAAQVAGGDVVARGGESACPADCAGIVDLDFAGVQNRRQNVGFGAESRNHARPGTRGDSEW